VPRLPAGSETSMSWLRVPGRHLGRFLLLLGFALIVTRIGFWGRTPADLHIFPGQRVQASLSAQIPFSYISRIETKRLITEKRSQVMPIYRIDPAPFENFKKDLRELHELLNDLPQGVYGDEEASLQIRRSLESFNRQHQFKADCIDASILLRILKHEERARVFRESLNVLQDISGDGVFADHQQHLSPTGSTSSSSSSLLNRLENVSVRSMEGALRYLRIHLLSMDLDPEVTHALFRIMKLGVRPNLIFDMAASEEKVQQLLATLPKVRKYVDTGSLLVTEGSLLSEEDYEKLTAYHRALHLDGRRKPWTEGQPFRAFIRTLALLAFGWFTIVAIFPAFRESRKNIALLFMAFLIDLLLIRAPLELLEFPSWQGSGVTIPLLSRFIPFSVGAMLMTLLMRDLSGLACGALTSAFYTLMAGRDLCFFLTSFAASACAVFSCRSAYRRVQIWRAGLLAGLVFSVGLGLLEAPVDAAGHVLELLTPIVSGLLSAMGTLGCLYPLKFLRYCSDLQLFELCDYNHPLIRRLQTEASGTYHHSLAVSSIAERMAIAVGANPILCWAAALYHDVGKIKKPEYFVENQRPKENLHETKKSELSAVIIRNHVREGVALGKKAGLPQPILDIIQQHHGDAIIRFFLEKAKSQPEADEQRPDENTFRYDGPKPQTREAAIVGLADAAEAASRTLRDPQALSQIEEMVDRLTQERLADHQFDECPLTLKDLQRLRTALVPILLGTLHPRVRYGFKAFLHRK